jgi:nitroreductase
MDLMEAIKTRRSIRQYQEGRPLSRQLIEELVDAARFAPTARLVQPWEFVVVRESSVLKEIAGLAENARFLKHAAACIAVFCRDTKYYLEDGCAATQNILLAARAKAIGSCWVAGDKKPYAQELCRLLAAPAEFKLVSLISLGYPASEGDFQTASRRSLQEIIHWEKF